jgi:CHAT domain-containing protein/Flp pilus assembly protein TadD
MVFLGLSLSLPLWAGDEPADELTKEQREQLQRRAEELLEQAGQLRQRAKYPDATKLLKKAIATLERLYPEDQYPHGHLDLATYLNNLGLLLQAQGDYAGARRYYKQAQAMFQALYPKEKHPQGHPHMALNLSNLGTLLLDEGDYGGARIYFQQAAALLQATYPKDQYPRGHVHLATNLSSLGGLLHLQGDYTGARVYLERALAMLQGLYPKEKNPSGHDSLALCLNNLGNLLQSQGDYANARAYLEQALAMFQRLYPKDEHPDGHRRLALILNNLGYLLKAQRDYKGARGYYQQALNMRKALYPKTQYPDGHADLAGSLNGLGTLLALQRDYPRAGDYYQQALAMLQALFPREKHSHGHPELALGLNNIGTLLLCQGDYAGAHGYYQRALTMYQALWPKDQYPHGHPYRAATLHSLGFLLQAQGAYAEALASSQQGLDMSQNLTDILMPALSEAEALNYLANLPLARDLFLSISRHIRDSDAACYAQVWRSKGTILRILRSRQRALRQLVDPESRDLWEQLVETRRGLARLILSPPRDPEFHLKRLHELTKVKEKLERQLAERSVPFRRQQKLERFTPNDLVQKLPSGSVFIDLLRYARLEPDPKVPGEKGVKQTVSYVAFVLRSAQPPLRVELGEAGAIDAAVAAWRRDLASRPASTAAAILRQLVWDRLAPHLPADTRTILLAPDGALTQLPWAALPGKRPGSVLLEDYAFAVVPHGPFLLEHLTAAPRSEPGPGLLLAVGDVQYDQEPRLIPEPKREQLLAWRPAERGSRTGPWSADQAAGVVHAAAAGPFQVLPFFLTARPSWRYLPGTLREVETVSRLAKPRPVQIRRGTEASTAQLLCDLPKARYALLATHGFFADPEFRSVFLLNEAAFRHDWREGRATPGARNPLVLSGLVLAGANQPSAGNAEGMSTGDGSILTAEMIASLPLEHLELVVLSACETGLGEVAGGEGVYGLQRAFHMAGAQTTVASLWQVDDDITQELLTRFFENLWHKGMGRLEALRQAQLAVRRGEGNRAHPRYWAAWVLSGDPGDLSSSSPSAVPAEHSEAVAVSSWWSGWPVYAIGVSVFGVVILGLVALQRRRCRQVSLSVSLQSERTIAPH